MDHYLHFIINKQSKNGQQVYKTLLIELPKYTQKYQLYPTKNIQELDNLLVLFKKSIAHDDIIVIVGGDGSLNHFISLYQKHQLNHSLAYIPSGSGNDFARTHSIPFETSQALQHLFQHAHYQKISFIDAQENSTKHYAVNSIGFGIDGLVNQLVNKKGTKKRFGVAAYLSVLGSAFTQQTKFPVTLRIDQGEFKFKDAQLVLVANNPFFGGGIEILPHADSSNDHLDILIANNVSLHHLFSIIFKIFTNKNHLDHPNFHYFQSKQVEIISDAKQYGQKDGEVFKQNNNCYSFKKSLIPFWI